MATPTALASASSIPATAGAFQDALGNVLANGFITFDLTMPAAITGGGEIVPKRVKILLDANGKVAAGQSIYRNTDLTPSGTAYIMQVFDANGNFVAAFGPQVITGSAPIDLAIFIPITTSSGTIGFPLTGVVLTGPSAIQTITGFDLVAPHFRSDGSLTAPAFTFVSDIGTGIYHRASGFISFAAGNSEFAVFGADRLHLGLGSNLRFGSGDTSTIAADTGLSRVSAGVLAAGNSAQGDVSGVFRAAQMQADGSLSAPAFAAASETNSGWFRQQAGIFGFGIAASYLTQFTATRVGYAPGITLGWASGAPNSFANDVGLSRISSGVLGIGTGGVGSTAATVQASLFQGMASTAFTVGAISGTQRIVFSSPNSGFEFGFLTSANAAAGIQIIGIDAFENSGRTSATGHAALWPDQTSHFWKANNNAGTSYNLVGDTTVQTLSNKTLSSANLDGTTSVLSTGSFQLNSALGGSISLGFNTATGLNFVSKLQNITDVIVYRTTTDTLTNKRITQRVTTLASSTTFTPDSDNADETVMNMTGVAGTITIAAPTGTPTDGQKHVVRLKTTNAQTYSFNATYRFSTTVAAPTTTTATKTDYLGIIWNALDTKWDVVAVDQGH